MRHRAFSFFEVVLAITVVGVAMVAIMQLVVIGNVSMRSTAEICQAVHLANNIHEFALTKPLLKGTATGSVYKPASATDPASPSFANMGYLDGWSSETAGPIDSHGRRITNMPDWSQSCEVKAFNISDPATLYDLQTGNATDRNGRKLLVRVKRKGETVFTCSWAFLPTIEK